MDAPPGCPEPLQTAALGHWWAPGSSEGPWDGFPSENGNTEEVYVGSPQDWCHLGRESQGCEVLGHG